ncbi:thymidylate kinase isoform X1 [Tachysurus ichikawai]
MDELELQLASNRFVRDCCEMIITETWLHTLIPNAAVQLSGRTIHRQDRNKDSDKNPRRVWQGIQSITNCKNNNHSTITADASLAEELNNFFVRFEVKQPITNSAHLPTSGTYHLTLQEHEDFLTNRPQTVKLGPHLSPTITLSTGLPQGCVLSPLLYSLYTYDCTPTHPTNAIIKFADDTTVIGLISGDDESAYRDEVRKLEEWCSVNNLSLNTYKTKELILDFRRCHTEPAPLYINGECVERVNTFKFLGVHISNNLSWCTNTLATIKKAQQRLYFLRMLRKNNIESKLLVSFYRSTIESVLVYCISVWYSSCTAADKKALHKIVNTAQKITGCPLPSLESIAHSHYLSRAKNIIKDTFHPGHHLFNLLPSGRRYRSLRAKTARLQNSFFPVATRTLNSMH